jgi:hypothetical protein
MKVSKMQFDNILGKMLKAEPQKRSETKPPKKKRRAKKAARTS